MGLYKKGRMWYMAVTANGRQFNRSTHTSNRQLAKRILAKIEGEIAEGRFGLIRSDPPKFEVWADQFIATIQHPNTRRTYASCVVALKHFFRNTKISDIDADRIETFKQDRVKSGTGPATVNRSLAVLRQLLKLAQRRRLVARNPMNDVDFLEERSMRRQPHIVTFAEQRKLEVVSRPLLKTLVVLLADTGLRVNREALPLRWQDIDFDDEVIHVRSSKTMSGRRVIPLSERCKDELLQWRNLTGPEYSPYVFPNPSNRAIPLKSVRKPWVTALKNSKIDYFPIYCLRASFASRLSAAGVPDVFVSQMMGHAGGLLHTYAKAIMDYRRDAIRKMEEFRQSHEVEPTVVPNVGVVQ